LGGGDPDPADGDVQTEYSTDQLYSPRKGAVTKYYLQELGHYRYCLIIWNIQ